MFDLSETLVEEAYGNPIYSRPRIQGPYIRT